MSCICSCNYDNITLIVLLVELFIMVAVGLISWVILKVEEYQAITYWDRVRKS